MKKRIFNPMLLALCISIILVSCASLPKPESPEDTLLVIVAEKDISKLGGLVTASFCYLELIIKDMDTPVHITGERYLFINKLAPGAHTTETVQDLFSSMQSVHVGPEAKAVDFKVPFILRPGTITIFPVKFILVAIKTGDNQFSHRWDLKKIDEEENTKVLNKLKNDGNFKLWKID